MWQQYYDIGLDQRIILFKPIKYIRFVFKGLQDKWEVLGQFSIEMTQTFKFQFHESPDPQCIGTDKKTKMVVQSIPPIRMKPGNQPSSRATGPKYYADFS